MEDIMYSMLERKRRAAWEINTHSSGWEGDENNEVAVSIGMHYNCILTYHPQLDIGMIVVQRNPEHDNFPLNVNNASMLRLHQSKELICFVAGVERFYYGFPVFWVRSIDDIFETCPVEKARDSINGPFWPLGHDGYLKLRHLPPMGKGVFTRRPRDSKPEGFGV